MGSQVAQARLERLDVWFGGVGLRHAAVIFERAQGGDDHDGRRRDAGIAALDVQEFFCAKVGAEARLGDGVVGQFKRQLGGSDRVAAVRDVGKRAAVHQRRGVFQRLHQVWFDGVLEQHRHRAVDLQVLGVDRLVVVGVGDQDVAQALLEILQVGGQAQDGHDLAGNGDLEAVLADNAVGLAAQTDDGVAQGAVVHIHAAFKEDAARVDAQLVALLQMVVQNGAQQVVGRGDGVHVAGEVQIDVLHRDHLRIAAAGSAALDAEYRAQRWLAQGDDGVFADLLHRLAKTDGRGGLALTGRGGVDGGDQHQLAVGTVGQTVEQAVRKFCLIVAVRFQLFRADVKLGSDLGDRLHGALLGDFDVCKHVDRFLLCVQFPKKAARRPAFLGGGPARQRKTFHRRAASFARFG